MLMREQQISVTDDAMVVEQMLNHPSVWCMVRMKYQDHNTGRSGDGRSVFEKTKKVNDVCKRLGVSGLFLLAK